MPRPPKNLQRNSDSAMWWTCPICFKRCKSKAGGRRHIRAKHETVSLNPFDADFSDLDNELPETPISQRPSDNPSRPNQNASPFEGIGIQDSMDVDLPTSPIPDDVAMHDKFTLPCSPTSSNHTLDSNATSNSSSEGNNLESNATSVDRHPRMNGRPTDKHGNFLNENEPPPPPEPQDPTDWTPFASRSQFQTAEFLFKRVQMSAGNIDELMTIWDTDASMRGGESPFVDYSDLYDKIDAIPVGGVPWESFTVSYTGLLPEADVPPWMEQTYEIHFRDPRKLFQDMLANPTFAKNFDYTPVRVFDINGSRRYENFMSGDWAWKEADIISDSIPDANGAMFVPIFMGSDKTVASAGTGQVEFWPLYGSVGNIHNNVRRAHGSGLVLIAFLAIPKTTKTHSESADFRRFRRQLFHASLAAIFESLKPGMSTPEVILCPDGHYRRIIWGLGPYIADYPEQVLLSCIVQGWCPRCRATSKQLDDKNDVYERRSRAHTDFLCTRCEMGLLYDNYGIIGDVIPFTNEFPRADIHELIAPDLLHQIIKGTFKDHLVTWVEEYLMHIHHNNQRTVNRILDDIDRRIAITPPFAGLRRFPEGRGFKQWTGDDSKALMKVYLPALQGHLPPDVIRTFRALLEFFYIARRDVITEDDLKELDDALKRFHKFREAFAPIRGAKGFSLPRQHSMVHYPMLIRLFGAPNGHCSSITESKHIRAVKEPWRRSNRNRAIFQIIKTNQRLDQLSAARLDFNERGMLERTSTERARATPSDNVQGSDGDTEVPEASVPDEDAQSAIVDDDDVLAEVTLAQRSRFKWNLATACQNLELPEFPELLRRFLYDQMYPNARVPSGQVSINVCPRFEGKISVFRCASAIFRAPSDPSGPRSMRREYIRATPSWRNGQSRYDTIFMNSEPELPGMRGLTAGRVFLFFSFTYGGVSYPCALVQWFTIIGDEPDDQTGLWMVEPDFHEDGQPYLTVIHLDSVVRAAHLIPAYRTPDFINPSLTMHDALDEFKLFYVNKFVDHHAFEIAA